MLPALYSRPDLIGQDLADGLRTFEAEEKRHSRWFREMNHRIDPETFSLEPGRYVFIPLPPHTAALGAWFAGRPFAFPCWIWLILLQEERSIHIARECLDERDALEPNFRQLHRRHMADEIGHVRWDTEIIDRIWTPMPMWKRRVQARLFGWLMREFFTVPKREGKAVLDALIGEFPELPPIAAQLRRELADLAHSESYHASLYSREITPKAFALFDSLPEFAGIGKSLPSRLNLLIAALQLAALLALLAAAGYLSGWALAALATAYALVMNSAYAMLHEAEHGLLHHNRRINDTAGTILALFFPAPFHLLRQGHIGHHLRNRSDDEAFDFYFEGESRVWKTLQLYGILTGFFYLAVALSNLLALVFLYLVPIVPARILRESLRKSPAEIPVGSRDFLKWWACFQCQVLFLRFPATEELIRLIPGCYSLWLRLWGSRIGSLTYLKVDPKLAFEFFKTQAPEWLSFSYTHELFERWVAFDPEGALEGAKSVETNREGLVLTVLKVIAIKSPSRALELLPVEYSSQYGFVGQVITYWVQSAPHEAAKWVMTQQKRNHLLWNLGYMWALENRPDAEKWVNTLSGDDHTFAIAGMIEQRASGRRGEPGDPVCATREFIAAFPDASLDQETMPNQTVKSLAFAIARHLHAKSADFDGLEWVISLKPTSGRDELFGEMMRRWIDNSPDEAVPYIQKMESGKQKEAALAHYIRVNWKGNPHDNFKLSKTIIAKEHRLAIQADIFHQWLLREPEVALAALNSLPVDEESVVKEKIVKYADALERRVPREH